MGIGKYALLYSAFSFYIWTALFRLNNFFYFSHINLMKISETYLSF